MVCFIMAEETSTYELRNRYNTSYVYFTELEADNCFILSTTKVYHNSVFNHWEFKVEDNRGNSYTWKDFWCAEAGSKADVKKAIWDHMRDDMIYILTGGANDHGLTRTTVVSADRGKDEYLNDIP